MKKSMWLAVVGPVVLVSMFAASPVAATSGRVDSPGAALGPVLSTSSDSAPPPVVIGEIDPNDPMVTAPGSALASQGSDESFRGTARCGSSAYAPPGGSQGPDSRASCSLAGSPGFRTGYSWQMQSGSGTRVCASGLGYNTAYAPVWYGVGCGGSGAVNVPWGNVLAYQKLHAYSINGYGGNVNWY